MSRPIMFKNHQNDFENISFWAKGYVGFHDAHPLENWIMVMKML